MQLENGIIQRLLTVLVLSVMTFSSDDSRSPARQIVDELRRLIATGELGPDAQLPSNAEMRNRYDVSNQTAQNAISALKREKLVYSVPGKGVFVRSDLNQSDLFTRLASEDGRSELYNDLLAQLLSLNDALSQLSEIVAKLEKRMELIEAHESEYQAGQSQAPSMSEG